MSSGIKIGKIISLLETYYGYKKQLAKDVEQYKYYKIVDNKEKVIELETKISEEQAELQKILDYYV